MKIGIVGSRRRDTEEDYFKVLCKFKEVLLIPDDSDDSIVSGGCPKGGDRFAERIAKELDIPIIIHLPKWEEHGKAAGFIRNSLIAEDCDMLVACVAPDRMGGTEDTIAKCVKLRKLVYLV